MRIGIDMREKFTLKIKGIIKKKIKKVTEFGMYGKCEAGGEGAIENIW